MGRAQFACVSCVRKAGLVLAAAAVMVCVLPAPASPSSINVALNGSVQLHGPFFTGGWGAGLTVPAGTIVDGQFLPRSTQWDQGAVWWDATLQLPAPQYIIIDLLGTYTVESFVLQGDDNDRYTLSYWNGASWATAWDVPAIGGWGMQTRPNPLDDAQRYVLASPITTSMLRVMGAGGDGLYSVSEVQAYGAPVPEPASLLLFGTGLIGAVRAVRRKRG